MLIYWHPVRRYQEDHPHAGPHPDPEGRGADQDERRYRSAGEGGGQSSRRHRAGRGPWYSQRREYFVTICAQAVILIDRPTKSAEHWQSHSHWREGGRSRPAPRVRWHQGQPGGGPEGVVPLPRIRHPGQTWVELAAGNCLTILWILCFLLVCNTPTNPKPDLQ